MEKDTDQPFSACRVLTTQTYGVYFMEIEF